jgi:hypothetical protein
MKRHNWPVEDYSIRPAGNPGECFYCNEEKGSTHSQDCVIRNRSVVVRMSVEYVVLVPESWTEKDIEWMRNEGTWCALNGFIEVDNLMERTGECGCSRVTYAYVREATEEDENRDKIFVAQAES